MSDINLLDQESSISKIKNRSKQWLSKLVGLVLVLSLLLYGYLFYQGWNLEKKVSESETKIEEYRSDIQNNKKRQELITRQGQLKSANDLLDKHMYWSTLLPELARVTLTNAKYTNIEANTEGQLSLTVSLPSYSDAEKYLQIFDLPEYNKNFSNVKLLTLTKTQEDQQFKTVMRLELTLSPDFLKKQP